MNELTNWLSFMTENGALVFRLSMLHLLLVFTSSLLAIAIAFPAAIWSTRKANLPWKGIVMMLANGLQAIPTLAVIGIASAVFALVGQGVGWWPALAALMAYSILPILANSIAGLSAVPTASKRAAAGLGMSGRDVLRQVEIPLALPLVFAGIRTATVINIGTAALAAAIGAECLGGLIFQGIAVGNINLILAGAVPTALLAVLVDRGLGAMERLLLSREAVT